MRDAARAAARSGLRQHRDRKQSWGFCPVSSKAPALSFISRPNSCRGSRPQSQEGDRMTASQDVFVGIDISKDRLDVHVRPLGVGFSVSNEAAGHAALIARLRPLRSKRIVLEATGGYERALWLALSEAGLVAAVVNPRQVREFARAAGRLAKSDRLDAAVIAHFAETFAPRPGKPDPRGRSAGRARAVPAQSAGGDRRA